MNCQHGGLPLDPQQVAQTGHCPRCGAAIAVQQPVAANAYTQPPAGMYPPPPPPPPYGAPPAFGVPSQGYPGGVLPPPQKKKAGLIAAISALVVVLLVGTLLALGFGGKGPLSGLGNKPAQTTTIKTPAATPTPSIPAGFQVYTSNGHRYSVAYPSDWTTSVDESDTEEVQYTGPANQTALTDNFTPNAGVTQESYTTTICGIVGDTSTISQPTQVTIGGQSWTKVECDSSDGTTHVVVEAVSYKGHIASLLFSSEKASFAQDQAQFFSVMEQTYTFLN